MGESIDKQSGDLCAVPLAFSASVPADPVGQVLSEDHIIADSTEPDPGILERYCMT